MPLRRVLALSLVLAVGPDALARKQASASALAEWITGPIRYIATADDARQFKALTSDEDRSLFIERFWSRRDPTPDTLTNEYRQLFWQRVQEANQSFRGSTKPGWMTDRGKVHILYGPPKDIENHRDLETDGIPGGGRGVIRWIYQGRPGGRRDLDPITVVAFVRDRTGEYRLTHDPTLSSVFFDAYTLEHRPFGRWTDLFLGQRRSELAVMLDLGKLQEVPPQDTVLLEQVDTIESYRTHPLAVDLGRFAHPQQDDTVVVVTIDLLRVEPSSDPALIARFTPRDATRTPRIIGEGSFKVDGTGGPRVAQGRIRLDAGTYDVLVMAADPVDASTGMYRGVLVVPPPSERLRLSDATLARELEPLAYRALASHDEPFILGPYRVVPRLDPRLPRGEAVELMFEIYGGNPPYRVQYRLEGQDDDGSWILLGQPQTTEQSEAAQAWGLPTGPTWPLGTYRVRIEVADAAGTTAGTLVPFELVERAGGE